MNAPDDNCTAQQNAQNTNCVVLPHPSGLRFLATAAFRRYLSIFGMSLLPFSSLRILVMRICGIRIGSGCYVGFNVAFDTNFPELIQIGRNVTFSHNVSIYAHTSTPAKCRLALVYHNSAPVIIQDGAWIAANAVILPGVTVANDCMIAAGAVVTRSTEPACVYAGNPARKIRELDLGKSVT